MQAVVVAAAKKGGVQGAVRAAVGSAVARSRKGAAHGAAQAAVQSGVTRVLCKPFAWKG